MEGEVTTPHCTATDHLKLGSLQPIKVLSHHGWPALLGVLSLEDYSSTSWPLNQNTRQGQEHKKIKDTSSMLCKLEH